MEHGKGVGAALGVGRNGRGKKGQVMQEVAPVGRVVLVQLVELVGQEEPVEGREPQERWRGTWSNNHMWDRDGLLDWEAGQVGRQWRCCTDMDRKLVVLVVEEDYRTCSTG